MVFVNGAKYACQNCIRGHRSSNCHHTDRPLFEIRKKGRPVSQCEQCRQLRKVKALHSRCDCADRVNKPSPRGSGAKLALPDGLRSIVVKEEKKNTSPTPLTPRASKHNVTSLLNPCRCYTGNRCSCGLPPAFDFQHGQQWNSSSISSMPSSASEEQKEQHFHQPLHQQHHPNQQQQQHHQQQQQILNGTQDEQQRNLNSFLPPPFASVQLSRNLLPPMIHTKDGLTDPHLHSLQTKFPSSSSSYSSNSISPLPRLSPISDYTSSSQILYDEDIKATEITEIETDERPDCSYPGIKCRCGDGCACVGCIDHPNNQENIERALREDEEAEAEMNAEDSRMSDGSGESDGSSYEEVIEEHLPGCTKKEPIDSAVSEDTKTTTPRLHLIPAHTTEPRKSCCS